MTLSIETKFNKFCSAETCERPGHDFVKIACNTAMTGTMVVEVLLCELCITTLEMGPQGTFLYVRRTKAVI